MRGILLVFLTLFALPAVLSLAPGEQLYASAKLAHNTLACGGGVRCEAYVMLPAQGELALSSDRFELSLAYLDGTESGIPIQYEVGHYEQQEYVAQEPRCAQALAENGTSVVSCVNVEVTRTRPVLVWHGKKLVKGENVLHLWTDEKPASAVVDWNFRMLGVPVQGAKGIERAEFDTRVKGWAIWGSAEYGWQNTSFERRRNFTIADAGRVNTPVRVNISSIGATTGSGFAIHDSGNASRPISYLDANERLTSLSNATYLLFTANSSETYFLYYNNNTAVFSVPAFLAWDRFVNSSNNLPWTVQGGTWTFSSGYASKSASGCFGNVCGIKTDVPALSAHADVGAFARAYYASRGDSLRFGFSCGSTWNAQGIFDDFGPDGYRSIGAGTASAYSSTAGSGGSLATWHDYTIRYGTSAHALYKDESTSATVTWTTPSAGQAFNAAYNATCMGGQEQGEGRFDDYALWNWTRLGRVNFYDSLTTGYALGTMQELPAAANESTARAAMLAGIANSEIAGSAISYTDRQVVIRLANGTQYAGTFDVFVASGNKRWAFNYQENTTPAFSVFENITPVFWAWQRANLTVANITSDVSALINATN